MPHARRKEKGASLIEFALAGVPLLLLVVSLVQMGLAMWSYHTLAFAVGDAAHFAATKGIGCTYTGNTCSVTVATVAQRVATAGVGLVPAQLNVTLTSSAGNVSCNPVSVCYTNATTWPPTSPTGTNKVGQPITVAAYYPVTILFLPVSSTLKTAALTLGASSRQLILF